MLRLQTSQNSLYYSQPLYDIQFYPLFKSYVDILRFGFFLLIFSQKNGLSQTNLASATMNYLRKAI